MGTHFGSGLYDINLFDYLNDYRVQMQGGMWFCQSCTFVRAAPSSFPLWTVSNCSLLLNGSSLLLTAWIGCA